MRHMTIVHAHDLEFECVRAYSNFYSFKRHVYQKHHEHIDVTPRNLTTQHVSDSPSVTNESDDNFDFANLL